MKKRIITAIVCLALLVPTLIFPILGFSRSHDAARADCSI